MIIKNAFNLKNIFGKKLGSWQILGNILKNLKNRL